MRDQSVPPRDPGAQDPVVAAYRRDLDRTLIRENLALTVEQRLASLQALADLAEELQRAGTRAPRW